MMRGTGVRLLVIDEVQNLLSGSRLQQRRLLNLLRWLGNELQIPLVAVGTAEALHAIQSDDQLANRFTPFGLPPWKYDGKSICGFSIRWRQCYRSVNGRVWRSRPSRKSF